MTDWGTLTDYMTGDKIRPATAQEWRKSNLISAATRGRGSTAGTWKDDDGRTVEVTGGPDGEIHAAEIRQLLNEAGSAGDAEQVLLCNVALGHLSPNALGQPMTQDGAWEACAGVILDNRMNSVA